MSRCPFCEIPCGNDHCAYNEVEMNDPTIFKLNSELTDYKEKNRLLMEENLSLLAKVQHLELLNHRAAMELDKTIKEAEKLFEILVADDKCYMLNLEKK